MSVVRQQKGLPERWADAHAEVERRKMDDAAGPDVLTVYNNQTADTWDVVAAPLSASNFESKWRVTFTPLPSVVLPAYWWYYTEFALSWQMVLNPKSYDEDSINYWDDPTNELTKSHKDFIVWFMNDFPDNQAINLKFSVKSTVEGTLTWTRLI